MKNKNKTEKKKKKREWMLEIDINGVEKNSNTEKDFPSFRKKKERTKKKMKIFLLLFFFLCHFSFTLTKRFGKLTIFASLPAPIHFLCLIHQIHSSFIKKCLRQNFVMVHLRGAEWWISMSEEEQEPGWKKQEEEKKN